MRGSTSNVTAVPLGVVMRSAWHRRWLGLVVVILVSVIVFSMAWQQKRDFIAWGSLEWGSNQPRHETVGPKYFNDVNDAERALRSALLREHGFADACSITAMNVTGPRMEVTCRVASEGESLAVVRQLARFIEAHHAPVFAGARRNLETQRGFLLAELKIAEESLQALSEVSAQPIEIFRFMNSIGSWRRAIVELRLGVHNLERELDAIRETRFLNNATIVRRPSAIALIATLSVVVGASLGVFAMLVFGVFDALAEQRRGTAEQR